MRWHHDNPRRFSRKWVSAPSEAAATELRIIGQSLTAFPVGLFSKPQRLNPFDNMENYDEEVHTLKCSCNSVYIAWNLGNGTASDLGTGILCAVLSQRRLQFMLQDNPRR
jgi:hypothetical protein